MSAGLLAFALVVFVIVAWLVHHQEPILRARLIAKLQARLNARVELDSVHLTLGRSGVVVSGGGLRVTNIGGSEQPAPSISVTSFQLHGGPVSMLLQAPGSTIAYIQGAVVTIPPTAERPTPAIRLAQGQSILPPDLMMLERLVATDTTLILEPHTSDRPPIHLQFDTLILGDFALGKAFAYEVVTEGQNHRARVHSTGHLGPWNEADPGEMPLDGNYEVSGFNLSMVHGLSGILAASGRVAGTVHQIAANGTSDTPDFALDSSAVPQPFHIDYHAVVDGTTSFLRIEPATLRLANSTIQTSGTISRIESRPGFETQLDLTTDPASARIEDILTFLAKPKPPFVKGTVSTKAHLTLLPGPESLIHRVVVTGTATVSGAIWSDPSLQQQLNSISMRGEDRAREAKALGPNVPTISASVTGSFHIANGNLDVSNVISQRPGATVVVGGRYELVGNQMDFHGVLRTAASASHMTSGFKSLLAKPLDPFLRKHGAGMELPIELKGDRTSPHLGIDLAHRGRDSNETKNIVAKPKP